MLSETSSPCLLDVFVSRNALIGREEENISDLFQVIYKYL